MLFDRIANIDPKDPLPEAALKAKLASCFQEMLSFVGPDQPGFFYELNDKGDVINDEPHLEECSIATWLLLDPELAPFTHRLDIAWFEALSQFLLSHKSMCGITRSLPAEGEPIDLDQIKSIAPDLVESAKLDDFALALLRLYKVTNKPIYAQQAGWIIAFVEAHFGLPGYDGPIIAAKVANQGANKVSWAAIKHVLVLLECHDLFKQGDLPDDLRLGLGLGQAFDPTDSLARKIYDSFESLKQILGSEIGFARGNTFRGLEAPALDPSKQEYKLYGNSIIGYALVRFLSTMKGNRDFERSLEQYVHIVRGLALDRLYDSSSGGFFRQISKNDVVSKEGEYTIANKEKYTIANSLASLFLVDFLRYRGAMSVESGAITMEQALNTRQLDVTARRLFDLPDLIPEAFVEGWETPTIKSLRLHPQYLRFAALAHFYHYQNEHKPRLKQVREKIGVMMNNKIFLSHHSSDKPFVIAVNDALKLLGFEPWLDKDGMNPGDVLLRGLDQGMEESCACVFFVSPSFEDKRFIKAEIDAARDKVIENKQFKIITLVLSDKAGKKGTVPSALKKYIWREPQSELEALSEILKALPLEVGKVQWKS